MHTYVDKKTGRKMTVSLLNALFAPQRPAKKAKKRVLETKSEPVTDPPAATDTAVEDKAPTAAAEPPAESANARAKDVEHPFEDAAETWQTWENVEPPAEDTAETWHTWEPPANFQEAAIEEAAVEEAAVKEAAVKEAAVEVAVVEEAATESTTKPVDSAVIEVSEEEPANSDNSGYETAEEDKKPGKVRSDFITDEGVQLSRAGETYLYRLNEHYERQKWLKLVARFEEKRGKQLNPKELRRIMDNYGRLML